MNKKFPLSFFLFGFFLDVVVKRFYLFVPSVIFMLLGIFIGELGSVGAVILAVDIVISFFSQLNLAMMLMNNDDPDFEEMKNNILSDNWRTNIKDWVEGRMTDDNLYRPDDDEDDNNGENE